METLSRILPRGGCLSHGSRSDFLFAMPRALFGIGSIANLAGRFAEYNRSASAEEADARAMRADWDTVGHDLRAAISRYAEGL
jgi:hypothetical protein